MKLTVARFNHRKTCTIGRLYIDDKGSEIFTLEDTVREEKIPGQTAIPEGRYKVIVDFSKHFGCDLPHILDVPGFEGVRIHPGNTDKDTEGCILVGKEWAGGDSIGRSRDAFNEIFDKIKQAPEVTLEVFN